MLTTVENDMVVLAQPFPVLFYGNVHMFQKELVSANTASTINPQQTTPSEFLSRYQTAWDMRNEDYILSLQLHSKLTERKNNILSLVLSTSLPNT